MLRTNKKRLPQGLARLETLPTGDVGWAKHLVDLVITCNRCGRDEHGDGLDFKDFWADLKEAGWIAKKVDQHDDEEEWRHFCPACDRAYQRKRRRSMWR